MFPLRGYDIQLYRVCEELSQALLCLMAVFGPWAFGTTQPWSIWVMNCGGYLLGLFLALKHFIRWLKGYRPPRWENPPQTPETSSQRRHPGFITTARLSASLAGLTLCILAYCLVGALNARATYHRDQLSFEYHDCVAWLPHSFDSTSTWFSFWTYLGLACSFWAARDWLCGKSSGEELAEWQKSSAGSGGSAFPLPARWRLLLWLLMINGALLGAECIIQRLENSPRLLFLIKPEIHQTADTQFGPYAYRANGAQYFNLLWPVCLGFWWTLNRAAGHQRKSHHVLLACGAVTAACPIVSTSRGGALIAVGIILLAAFFLTATHFLLAANRQQNRRTRILTLSALILFFAVALGLGFSLGWKALKPRMRELNAGYEGREEMYDIMSRIADDYPAFGTGPGTYESVSELYRPPGDSFWPTQVHNDWLETRITFGWVGSALIYLALGLVGLRWFLRGGIHGGRRFVTLVWLALVACLLHARFDFPFQIHSILFLFLLWCAVLFSLSRRPVTG